MKKLVFVINVLLLCSSVFAQSTYYVDEVKDGGSDTNTGAIDQPFATIAKALSVMSAGDICEVKAGTYHEEIDVNDLNASGAQPTIIRPYNNEQVIIDGTIEVSSEDADWTLHSGNIYKTKLNDKIWQLFIDDKEQVMARWPNAQFVDPPHATKGTGGSTESIYSWDTWAHGVSATSIKGHEIIDASSANKLPAALNTAGALDGAIGIMNVGSFKTWTEEISNHTVVSGTHEFDYTTIDVGTIKNKHHYFFVEGKLSLLDNPNEWFFDTADSMLYVYTDNGQKPTGRKIRGKNQSYAFTVNNSDYFHIKGLNFFGTTVKVTASDYFLIEDINFAYPSCSKRMLREMGLVECTEIGTSSGKSNNSVIRRCVFEYTDGSALNVHGNNNLIENNYFHHIDYSASELEFLMCTINIGGDSNKFTKNKGEITGASVFLAPGTTPEFSYNEVTQTGYLQSDGAVLQGTQATVSGANLHHNIIYETPKYALRFDAPAGDATAAGQRGRMHHNVIWETNGMMIKGDFHFIVHNTEFNSFKGNSLIVLSENAGGSAESDTSLSVVNKNTITQNNFGMTLSGHRSSNYNFPGKDITNWNGYKKSGISADQLIDLATYLPVANSALIDAGTEFVDPDGLITHTSHNGTPDIGAFESGVTPWTAGIDWDPTDRMFPWPTPDIDPVPELSNDASLKDITLDHISLAGFASSTLEYNVELPYGTIAIPQVNGVVNDAKANLQLTSATTLPGTTFLVVTAEDDTTTNTYKVNFTIAPNNDATLDAILVDGENIHLFDSAVVVYNVALPFGTETIPVVEAALSDTNATIVITQAVELPGSAKIDITADDKSTVKSYTVNFSLAPNTDASLKNILLDGVGLSDFDPQTFKYHIELDFGTVKMPVIAAEANDTNAVLTITKALTVTDTALIEVTAADQSTKLSYTLIFSEAPAIDGRLSDLKVDGVSLSNFNSDTLVYYYELPFGTVSFPVVDAVANDENATMEVAQVSSLPDTALVKVTAGDQSVLNYSVIFTLAPEIDARLTDIKIDGESIVDFSSDISDYHIELANDWQKLPVVSAVANDTSAEISITQADTIPGSASIKVLANDKLTTKTYTVTFSEAKSTDATLSGIYINGNLLNGFNALLAIYEVELAYGTTDVPEVLVSPTDSNAIIAVSIPDQLPGTGIIKVTAEDGTTTRTYIIDFKLAPNSDATLAEILVDSVSLLNFYKDTLNYGIELPYGTNEIPVVNAVTSDSNALIIIVQSTDLPGAATILVKAEDSVSVKTYTINFTIAPNNDATLKTILVSGSQIDGFNAEQFTYNIELPYNTTEMPVIEAVLNDTNAQQIITKSEQLPGKTEILVTAADDTTSNLYTINFTIAPNTDAALIGINIDGTELKDFDTAVLSYTIELPFGTVDLPVVGAMLSDTNATMQITQVEELPGKAIVEVTAEDNKTSVMYELSFTLGAEPTFKVTFVVKDAEGSFLHGLKIKLKNDTLVTNQSGKAELTGLVNEGNIAYELLESELYPSLSGTFSIDGEDALVELTMQSVGINDNSLQELHIYPNPAKDMVYFTERNIEEIHIVDLKGNTLIKLNTVTNNFVDVSALADGMYFVIAKQAGNKLFRSRLLIQ